VFPPANPSTRRKVSPIMKPAAAGQPDTGRRRPLPAP
jgi:hypothetical protein